MQYFLLSNESGAPDVTFDLQSYIPYLVRRIVPASDKAIRADLMRAGLTLEMWRVVVIIHEFGPQSLGSLSEFTSINVSTLSRMIGRMETRRLIRRRRSGKDASVEIDLRPLGRKKCEILLPRAAEMERRIAQEFDANELAVLRKLLVRLHDAVVREAGHEVGEQARQLRGESRKSPGRSPH